MFVVGVLGHVHLTKCKGAGEGEGAAAWRAMHEQWEPRSRSRFTGMVLCILSYRFTGDAQAAIESFERCIRENESRGSHTVPEFVTAVIVINGIEEQTLRDHLVMHSAQFDSDGKLKQEILDIARAKSALGTASTSSPMEVDALRRDKGKEKGKDKGKGKDNGKKKRDSQDADASKGEKATYFYCGKLGTRRRSAGNSRRTRPRQLRKASLRTSASWESPGRVFHKLLHPWFHR